MEPITISLIVLASILFGVSTPDNTPDFLNQDPCRTEKDLACYTGDRNEAE